MNVSLMISRRVRLAGDGRGPSRSGVIIVVAGIALALAVMLLSVAVSEGFKQAISAKVEGFEADITLIPMQMADENGQIVALGEADEARGDSVVAGLVRAALADTRSGLAPGQVAMISDRPGIIKTDSDFLGVNFRSYSPGHDFTFERSLILSGHYPEKSGEIALSQTQARRLGVACGDRLLTHFISDGGVRTRRFTVAGIYSSNFGEYDKTLAYASDSALRAISGVGSNSVEVRRLPQDDIDAVASRLQKLLDQSYASGDSPRPWLVQSLWHRGAMFFSWLGMLDTNVAVILVLMACVSGFTLISSLIILILERVRLIGILKSLGATNRQVRGVFMWLGTRIVLLGLLIGNAVALALILAQQWWRFIPLDPESYYLSYVPVKITLWQVAAVNGGVLALALLLMLLPSAVIARISPSAVMRYE